MNGITSETDVLSSARSEPVTVLSSPNVDPLPDELFRLKLSTIVKPYQNAQNRSGESLGSLDINVSTVPAFWVAIFEVAVKRVEGIAVATDSGYAMRPGQVSFQVFA